MARSRPSDGVPLRVAVCLGVSLFLWISLRGEGRTALEKNRFAWERQHVQEWTTLSRRYFFFGHTELADIVTGLEIIAASVDLVQNSSAQGVQGSPVRARFEDAIAKAHALAPYAIGMDEVYLFPSMVLLFDDEDPPRAFALAEKGAADPRTDARLALLAAFTAHIFLRDPAEAGRLYAQLAQRPEVPSWVGELAQKLQSGQDPFLTDESIRNELSRTIERSFPRARRYFQRSLDREREAR